MWLVPFYPFILLLWSTLRAIDGFLVPDRKTFGPQTTSTKKVSLVSTTTTSATEQETKPWTLNPQKHGPFNQEEDWGFAYSSVSNEACSTYVIDNVEGEIPFDLCGTYYKAGPGNFEREGRRYEHVLDGDGFIAAFRFAGGKAPSTGRFVETEYFRDEMADDKIKYRNVFGTQPKGGALTNAFDLTLKNVANTNVIKWGGRLFALWEGGRP